MHRVDTDGNVSNLFSDGSPGVSPATVVDAAWLNDVQENVCQAIEAAGITLSKGDYTQLKSSHRIFNGDTDETIAARHSDTAPVAHRLIDRWSLAGSPTVYGRLYAAPSQIEITINASWNGTNWVADDTTKPARKLLLTQEAARLQGGYFGGFDVLVKGTTTASWDDASWDANFLHWGNAGSSASLANIPANVAVHSGQLVRSPNGTVTLYLTITTTAIIAAFTVLCSLPAGFRPYESADPLAFAADMDGSHVLASIATNGDISLHSSTTSSSTIRLAITFYGA